MPIFDNFQDYNVGLTGPICGGFDISPDDDSDLVQVTRAFMVSGAGDVSVVLKSGATLNLAGLTSGVLYPFRVCKICATGTTATGIVGLV